MSRLNDEIKLKMASRLKELAAVKVPADRSALGCCGRSDGSYRCSSR